MRCYACHKPIKKAALTVRKNWTTGGISGVDVMVYGPKCAERLGLIPARVRKPQQWDFEHKAKRHLKCQLAQVQDGQQVLFEGLVA